MIDRFLILSVLALTLTTTTLAEDELKRVDTSGPIPSDAIVIFDGSGPGLLVGHNGGPVDWPIEDGAITVDPEKQQQQQGLWTKLHFHAAQIHVEFRIPETGDKGAGAGNSGLYFHGLFEQQIHDSFDNPDVKPIGQCGSIYGIGTALVGASRPVGKWQTYDIIFHAPERNAEGEAVEPGTVTTLLNGVLVQNATPILQRKSSYTPLYFRTNEYSDRILESLKKTGCGPMQLQDHKYRVSFRNIWIRPLDDRSFEFEPKMESTEDDDRE